METQTCEPKIVRGQNELWIPHKGRTIRFLYPAFGPNAYRDAREKILSRTLDVPIGDYTASLLHSAYCSKAKDEPEFKDVRNIVRDNWLWVFNRNLWTDNGVYIVLDKDTIGRSQLLDINELEKMLRSGKEISGIRFSTDGNVRFAPKGSYNLGETTSEEFAKDGFIIASFGIEEAEKIGEVSATFRKKPYTFGLDIQKGQAPELRVSAVLEDGVRLGFDGDDWGDDYKGHAFGVLK